MLHQKVPLPTQREGRDSRFRAQEALVIAVEGDTVCAGSVVVDQTEIVAGVCCCGGNSLEEGEGLWDRPWCGLVLFRIDGLFADGVNDGIVGVWGEEGCFVEAEDGGVAWCVYYGFFAEAIDGVPDAVEEEVAAEEVEESGGEGSGDEGLEVEEVEVGLVGDRGALSGDEEGELGG